MDKAAYIVHAGEGLLQRKAILLQIVPSPVKERWTCGRGLPWQYVGLNRVRTLTAIFLLPPSKVEEVPCKVFH